MILHVLLAMSFSTWLIQPAPTDSLRPAPAEVAGLPPFAPLTEPAPEAAAPAPAAPGGPPSPIDSRTTPASPPPDRVISEAPASPPRLRRFVIAYMPALTFGVSLRFIPSINPTVFLGGRLKRHPSWALGYMLTVSFGLAERYFSGLLTHRHHLTALHNFGRRGFATVGAGVGFMFFWPSLVEAESRLGVRLGKRSRLVLGGLLRLGLNFAARETAPLPQLGVFLGQSFF